MTPVKTTRSAEDAAAKSARPGVAGWLIPLWVVATVGLLADPSTQACEDGLPPLTPGHELRLSDYLPAETPAVAKRIYRLKFSPSGRYLAIRDGLNQVWQYDGVTGSMQLAQRLTESNKRIEDLAYSADGQWLYAISDSGQDSFQVWSTDQLDLALHADTIRGQQLTLTLAGEMLINGRDTLEFDQPDQSPKIRKRAGLLRSWEGSVSLLMYNLAGQSRDSGLEWRERVIDAVPKVVAVPPLAPAWQTLLQKTVGRAVGRQTAIGPALQLSPDGNRMVLHDKRAILLWDVAADQPWRELGPHLPPPQRIPLMSDIYSLRFSPNGQWLAVTTVGENGPEPIRGEVHLVDAIAGRWLGQITATTQAASALDFSPDQKWLVVASTSLVDDRIQFLDLDRWWSLAPPPPLGKGDTLAERWPGLSSEDPLLAITAVRELGNHAAVWQAAVTQTLTYDPAAIVQNVARFTQRLDSEKFREREAAEQELRVIAEHFPLLLQELQSQPTLSSESHFRLQRIQSEASAVVRLRGSDWRLYCRLLQVLEQLPDDWAGDLLQQATQHPIRSLARQARVSQYVRQARRSNPPN